MSGTCIENTGKRKRRPAWLNKKINLADCYKIKTLLNDLELNTVCQEASCPNIGECFKEGHATFIILGSVCSRNCRFCNIESGMPDRIDRNEPGRVAEAARRLKLKHVVITGVTRDDLAMGGADIFSDTIKAVREKLPASSVEVLIPDFKLNLKALKLVADAKPDIINHNLETVRRLYDDVRPRADYRRSLDVLRTVKEFDNNIYTKSGLMLGLGEKETEVIAVMEDLRSADCDFLSLGQYLAPTSKHVEVAEFIRPEMFDFYKKKAYNLGFRHVESGSYVRSSYKAKDYLDKVNED